MKNNEGFFLAEAIFAVLLLTLVMLVSFPLLYHTYQERQAIEQKKEALSLLQNALLKWQAAPNDDMLPAVPATRPYVLDWKKATEHEAKLCVHWPGLHHEEYRLCSEGKK
ncbi:hypothetical protein QS257_09085 [Terrilactibacillus sp. S3-3]|nr:hypothetical protein QS257_09085 [Terrilactibacillus sp. S3-3]